MKKPKQCPDHLKSNKKALYKICSHLKRGVKNALWNCVHLEYPLSSSILCPVSCWPLVYRFKLSWFVVTSPLTPSWLLGPPAGKAAAGGTTGRELEAAPCSWNKCQLQRVIDGYDRTIYTCILYIIWWYCTYIYTEFQQQALSIILWITVSRSHIHTSSSILNLQQTAESNC